MFNLFTTATRKLRVKLAVSSVVGSACAAWFGMESSDDV